MLWLQHLRSHKLFVLRKNRGHTKPHLQLRHRKSLVISKDISLIQLQGLYLLILIEFLLLNRCKNIKLLFFLQLANTKLLIWSQHQKVSFFIRRHQLIDQPRIRQRLPHSLLFRLKASQLLRFVRRQQQLMLLWWGFALIRVEGGQVATKLTHRLHVEQLVEGHIVSDLDVVLVGAGLWLDHVHGHTLHHYRLPKLSGSTTTMGLDNEFYYFFWKLIWVPSTVILRLPDSFEVNNSTWCLFPSIIIVHTYCCLVLFEKNVTKLKKKTLFCLES